LTGSPLTGTKAERESPALRLWEAGVDRYATCAWALPREADQRMRDGLVTERE
jgi:hypothetical protein